jgi:acyl-CoA reductase-like NAD-dependent aldehyde dehydrogenase
LVVLCHADPQAAATVAAARGSAYADQICMADSRVIVERPLLPARSEAFTRVASTTNLRDPRDERTAYGAPIDERALAAVQRGAIVLAGGEVAHGLTCRPTIPSRSAPRLAAVARGDLWSPGERDRRG